MRDLDRGVTILHGEGAWSGQEKQVLMLSLIHILSELGDRKYTIQRSKGLGENEPEDVYKRQSVSRLSSCRRCVDLSVSSVGKKNWSTDTSKKVTSS